MILGQFNSTIVGTYINYSNHSADGDPYRDVFPRLCLKTKVELVNCEVNCSQSVTVGEIYNIILYISLNTFTTLHDTSLADISINYKSFFIQ